MSELDAGFGVYVHVPYCRRICPYCDFNVHIARRADWEGLARGMGAELVARSAPFAGLLASSLYFGGGTPSLAPVALLDGVREAVAARFGLAADAEVTVEVDPATLARDGFAALRRLGVTRVSLGWQSTHDRLLRVLGRGHAALESREAYEGARAAGFEDVSIDLIFAVPGQTMADLDRDLDEIEQLAPDHVSLYAFTYHEGTELFRRRAQGRVVPVTEELELEMMLRIEARLVGAGFEHYEVSNYARPGKRSRHNMLYWGAQLRARGVAARLAVGVGAGAGGVRGSVGELACGGAADRGGRERELRRGAHRGPAALGALSRRATYGRRCGPRRARAGRRAAAGGGRGGARARARVAQADGNAAGADVPRALQRGRAGRALLLKVTPRDSYLGPLESLGC